MEAGESFAEAAARELLEETGLAASVVDLEFPQSYRVPETLRQDYLEGVDVVAVESFTVEVPPGWEPVLNEEHDSYRWLSSAEAAALAHWPETRELILAVARRPRAAQ